MDNPAWQNRAVCSLLIRIAHAPCNQAREDYNQRRFYNADQRKEHCPMQQSEKGALRHISDPETELTGQTLQQEATEQYLL